MNNALCLYASISQSIIIQNSSFQKRHTKMSDSSNAGTTFRVYL